MHETKEFEQYQCIDVRGSETMPRKSFFEPISPAQQLYESLRYVYTGQNDFFQEGRQLVHLNGQSEALMSHFRNQGMSGLLGFDHTFINRCTTCSEDTIACVAKRGSVGSHTSYGEANVPIFRCPRCGSRYSARHATALWNVRINERKYCQIAKALAEGFGIRTTARIFDVDKDTVCRCAFQAGIQCQFVDSILVHHLHLEECQLDEMWSFVYKKQHHLEPFEQLKNDIGDVWLHVAFEPRIKILVAVVLGKRTLDNLRKLTQSVHCKSDGHVPLFTTDEYPAYLDALLWEYGQLARVDREGLVGRPSEYSYLIPTNALTHAKVKKTRRNGRVEAVETEVSIGTEGKVQQIINESPCSRNINISFVERSHLHQRLNNRRLTRKTLGFSKTRYMHEAQIWLCSGYYHFVRPHSSLAIRSDDGIHLIQRTPAMAAGVTDHIWSIEELLTFPNCYHN
jgi:IS1 family transposase/transposase-like protein